MNKRDWQDDKTSNLLKRCEIAKSYNETICVWPDAIIELINKATAEKERAETLHERIEVLSEQHNESLAREQKLVQHLRSYMPHMWPIMATHFEVLLDSLYPKEETE